MAQDVAYLDIFPRALGKKVYLVLLARCLINVNSVC